MSTISFIGSDGSGKTTIIGLIQDRLLINTKYIYMGLNLESSNYSLPTSRLLLKLKLRMIKKKASDLNIDDPVFLTTHHIMHRQQERSKALIFFRTINRIFEAWYRQIISWYFQARGYVVIYDRHFLFDTAPNPEKLSEQPFSNKLYRWLMIHFYPQPGLVLFLDADPEILLGRKKEVPLDYLVNQRKAYISQGEKTKKFITIDASQSIEKVFSDVEKTIADHLQLIGIDS